MCKWAGSIFLIIRLFSFYVLFSDAFSASQSMLHIIGYIFVLILRICEIQSGLIEKFLCCSFTYTFCHIYLNRLDVDVWHASNGSYWFMTFVGKLVVDDDVDAEHSDATYPSNLASSKSFAVGNYLFHRTHQISA